MHLHGVHLIQLSGYSLPFSFSSQPPSSLSLAMLISSELSATMVVVLRYTLAEFKESSVRDKFVLAVSDAAGPLISNRMYTLHAFALLIVQKSP